MANGRGEIPGISEQLSQIFQRLVPLHPATGKGGKRPSEQEIGATSEKSLKEFYAAARKERLQHGLGIIGRARVAFSLQQNLLAAGYPPTLVKQVLFAMLMSAFVSDEK